MIVTIHLGASSLVVTVCKLSGEIVYHVQSQVSREQRIVQTYESLLSEIEFGFEQVRSELNEDFPTVVLTAPVPIDWKRGIAGLAPGMPAIQDRSLKADVANRLKRFSASAIEVFVENDANAAALCSFEYGAGKGCDLFVHARISTGLGGCIMMSGKPFGGAKGLAGEIGHVILQPSGMKCGCSSIGCAETLIGGSALLASIRRNSWTNHRYGHFLEAMKAVNNGDTFVEEEFKTMGRYLGLLLASVANILNPKLVTISGPLLDQRKILYTSAVAEFGRRVCAGLECPVLCDEFGRNSYALSGLAVYSFQTQQYGEQRCIPQTTIR